MKTAEEWNIHPFLEAVASQSVIWLVRDIQADALRHAAKICRKVNCVHQGTAVCHDYDAHLLEAEVAKLEAKQ